MADVNHGSDENHGVVHSLTWTFDNEITFGDVRKIVDQVARRGVRDSSIVRLREDQFSVIAWFPE